RMARMIDQLLDFTRVRVGAGFPLRPEPANLMTIVRQVVDELENASPVCTFLLEQDGDTRGDWDVDRLSQVFSNLVANAVQHGEHAHGVSIRIDGTNASVVRVDVHNQGFIPPEILPHLFDAMKG